VQQSLATLDSSVLELRGVGPASARDLSVLGIKQLRDLVEHLPARHEQYGAPQVIASVNRETEEPVLIKARILSLRSRRSFRRRLTIQEGLLQDESGSLAVVWFNQHFLLDSLQSGQQLMLRGNVTRYRGKLTLVSPEVIRDPDILSGQQKLLPVYPLSGHLTTKQIRFWVKQALPLVKPTLDVLPSSILTRHKLIPRVQALRELHFPTSAEHLAEAKRRMTFEELFVLSLYVLRERLSLQQISATPVPINETLLKEFTQKLPYKLTDAQRRAAWQIQKDLARPHPMNRLLEGDVGSGKTVVAAMSLLTVAHSGGQAVILAPTVVLARQHVATLRTLLKPHGLGVGLFAGSIYEDKDGQPQTRADLLKQLASGTLRVVVATHGVLRPEVRFKSLRLFVVDEQHRFGVSQRQALKHKVGTPNHLPHLLSMTATPIPRSLALTLYGDLDLSVLDQKPSGRSVLKTKLVTAKDFDKVMDDLLSAVARGEQCFVLFPLIHASETLRAKAVTVEIATLQKKLAGARIGMVHGSMTEQEKEETMSAFRRGEVDVLAATPVIEVGIDVPNATRMLICSADRFGLAQLHQLRGRIGRGSKPGVCYVMPDSATPATRQRLQLISSTNDGFALAEADLELRGPGEVFGTRQHGQVTFKYATVFDARVLAAAKEEATQLLTIDPNLRRWPNLRYQVTRTGVRLHLE
jgi:ATP-dependent DNA helicase RecG